MDALRATASGVLLNPLSTRTLVSDPVPIASGRLRPTQKVEAPEIDVIVGKPPPPPLHVATASAARPPQPVAILMSARPLCHAWIWSEWEKSANGFGTLPFMYSVWLIGWTSGPVLVTTASLFAL